MAEAALRLELVIFDRVVLTGDDGPRTLALTEFLALPLHERIRLNFERKLDFLAGANRVEPADALKSLMKAARG